ETSMRPGLIGTVFVLYLTAGFGALPADAADDASAFDMLGLRLGMTADEARAALKTIDPKIRIDESKRQLIYTDGVEAHRTEPFLYSITGSGDIADEAGNTRRW